MNKETEHPVTLSPCHLAFRRVDAGRAGASALGILVPPGEATLVIVRPRPLAWDLLPARWDGDCAHPPAFCTFGRDEAAAVARRLQTALEKSVQAGSNPIESFGDVQAGCGQLWLRTDEFVWIVCRRSPGQAYQPAIFTTREGLDQAAAQLRPFLWPAADGEQEYYFNTQLFA